MTQPPSPYFPFVSRVLIVIALASLTFLAWYFRDLLLLILGSVLVAVILSLIASPFHHRLSLPRGVALAIAVLLVVGLFASVGWMFGAEIRNQTETLREMLPKAVGAVQARLDSLGIPISIEQMAQGGEESIGGSGIVSSIGGFAMSVGSAIVDFVLVLVAGIFLAAQPDLYRRGVYKLVPEGRRPLLREALHDAGHGLGLWLKGRLLAMALVGVLTGLGLWLIGIPSFLTLGLLAALLDFVPFIGPIIAAIPAVLLALTLGTDTALWTALLYLGVQQVEGNILDPIVQQRMVTLPPAFLLFSMVAAGLLFGVAGIILGAPLAVVIYVLVKRLYVREALHTPTKIPGEEAGS